MCLRLGPLQAVLISCSLQRALLGPAFVCLFFASPCRKGTCCLLPHREGNKKFRSRAQSFSELPASGCSASSVKLRQRGQTLLVACPAANSVGPSLRICQVFCLFHFEIKSPFSLAGVKLKRDFTCLCLQNAEIKTMYPLTQPLH